MNNLGAPIKPTAGCAPMAIEPLTVKNYDDADRTERPVGFNRVRNFQNETAASASIWTDDERFWRMLYGTEHYG